MSTRRAPGRSLLAMVAMMVVTPLAQPRAQTRTPQQAMADRLAAYTDALKRKDTRAGDLLFTQDALLVTLWGELNGAAALASTLAKLFATATVTEATLTITAAEVSDTSASTLGCYTEVLSRTGRPLEPHAGTFIAVWRRQSDGGWKIRRIITTDATAC